MSPILWIIGKFPRSWIKQLSSLRFKHPILEKILGFATRQFQSQDGVIQQGIGKGLKFNTGGSAAGYLIGTSEPEMQEVLKLFSKPGMVVYDVGANVGFFSILARSKVGKAGAVYSFEPLEKNADSIRHNCRLNQFDNVTIRVEALGSEDTEAEFVISKTMTLGRLSSTGGVPEETERIKVPVRKLDSLWAQGVVRPPDLMKIDIEGAEVEMLKGAQALIRKSRPILLIELHGTNVGVASELEQFDYVTRAFGKPLSIPIVDCPWNAQILAVPSEKRELLEHISAIDS